MSKPGKIVLFLLKLTVSCTLLYVVLSRADPHRVISLMKDISPVSFALAVLLYLLSQFTASARWKLLIRDDFGLGRLFPLYLLGSFFNTFLPGLVGGDAVKAYYLYRESGRGTQAMASVFMDRYIGFCSLMVLGTVVFPFGLSHIRGTWVQWLMPLIVICFIAASYIVLGLRLGGRVRFIDDIHGYLRSYGKQTGAIARAALLSVIVQFIMIVMVFILSRGLGEDISFLTFALFFPIIVTVSTIPVSVSGLGIREAAFVVLLGTQGVEAEAATAISFAWFLAISTGGLAGLYEYLRHKGHAD
jgi:uncharacterized membrane protein YbhN (UPF0104 family)